jgi:hypothetical protein
MPEVCGFGRREEDGREFGAATIIVSFPKAMKHIAERDTKTGGVAFRSVPNPHKRAMSLADLRDIQKKLTQDAEGLSFFKQAESMLLDHIETTPAAAVAHTDRERFLQADPLMARADAVLKTG